MSSRARRRHRGGGRRETAEKRERWQFVVATVTRVVIEVVLGPFIDRYLGGGGPGRLL